MFDLILMRHAKSDWHAHSADIDRPLNARGVADAIQMGRHLKLLDLVPDYLIVSDAKRTRETATRLLESLPVPQDCQIFDKELYLADKETLLELIGLYAEDNRRLMVLAHNPGLDDLVTFLASFPPLLSSSGKLMVTCAVAHFQIASIEALRMSGQNELKNLYRPKEI